jgi:hypothetical protein
MLSRRAILFLCSVSPIAAVSCSSTDNAGWADSDAGGSVASDAAVADEVGQTTDARPTGDASQSSDASGMTDGGPTGADGTGGNPPSDGADSATGSPDAGGTTGNPDTGVISHPVSCDSLSMAVGTWQDITPQAFSNPPNMETLVVAVNPQDETVYAAASNKTNGAGCPSGSSCPDTTTGIYKSSDCGATWTPITTKTPGTDSANLFSGSPWAFLIDQVEPSVMYLANGYGDSPTVYKSTNGGVDWTALNPDPAKAVGMPYPFVQSIAIDPFNHGHLAVTFHADCSSPYNGFCLSESEDGGGTWKEFNGPSAITGWLEGASINIIGPTHYIVVGSQGVWYSGDTGGHWTQLGTQWVTAPYSGVTHIGPDGTLYVGAGNSVMYSPPAPNMVPPFAIGSGTPSLSVLSQSPGVTFLVDDGVNLYATPSYGYNDQEFFSAPLGNLSSWKQMPDKICSPGGKCRGADEMAYDAAHHVVYAANWAAGLWRLVTR